VVAVSTSTSVWQAIPNQISFPSLVQNITVDVAIVGGGITGLTAALLLKRAGLSVAVIEALTLEGGVTAYTTAHISEVPDIGYETLISDYGESDARLAAEARRQAIEQIARFVEIENIECGFERVPGYYYAESADEIETIEKEAEAARRLGVDATVTYDIPLPFGTGAGILFPNQAQFHAVQYLQALAQAIDGNGSHIFEQTRVVDISGSSPYRVTTQQGTVTAQNVILATHTPIHDIANMQDLYLLTTKLAPYRSYVLGVRLRSPAPVGLFWDTMEPYHYTRNFADANGELLIVGGEDHKTGADVDQLERYERLEAYVRERYDVDRVEYRWSAQWYEPIDGLPFIGKSPAHDRLYVATGFSGNGMSFGTIAGMVLSDQILGRDNPWSDLYNPSRVKPLAGIQDFVSNNLDVAKHFVGDRFQSEVQSLDDVPRGEGRLLKVDGEQLAVYRDLDGKLHAVSPVCTHAGCIVNWNNAEQSWDCPCHGGRFSCTGQVLNGPPIRSLQAKPIQA
jgi:glycine/D-amino acid oxidase-like deaminating enzyme/nitrite reductase/ring-hydroxylating ferredoxin subunit